MSLQAYRIACHVGDSEDNLPGTMQALGTAALDKLVLFMLTEVSLLTQCVACVSRGHLRMCTPVNAALHRLVASQLSKSSAALSHHVHSACGQLASVFLFESDQGQAV